MRALDEPAAYADNRIGFQGLFADRFDADAPHPEMAVGADQTYYARNRDYRPDLGRWMQRDPNGSGLGLVDSPPMLGTTGFPSVFAFQAKAPFVDGGNLLQFAQARPHAGTDPMGLWFGLGDLGAANSLATDLRSDQLDLSSDAIINVWALLDPHAARLARHGKTTYTFLSTGMIEFQVGRSGVLRGAKRVNAKGLEYPAISDLRTGGVIPFPNGSLQRLPESSRVPWGETQRREFKREWRELGYPEPPGGWAKYDIHHIHPRAFGGDNSFWNLVPVKRHPAGDHKAFNRSWQGWE